MRPPSAGELRIAGVPASRAAAVERVARSRGGGGRRRRSPASRSPISKRSRRANGVTLRALLEELRAAGLELVAEAPFDRLQDPRRSIEEVNIAGLALARLTVEQAAVGRSAAAAEGRSPSCSARSAVMRAFAPLPRRVNPAVPTTGYDDVKRVALARLVVRQRAVDSGRLVALRSEARAGRADRRRRRRGRRVGRGRDDARGAAARRSRRSAATSARPGSEPVERNGRFDVWRLSAAMTRRVRLGAVGYLNARPLVYGLERAAAIRSSASTSRRSARGCCTRARSTSA